MKAKKWLTIMTLIVSLLSLVAKREPISGKMIYFGEDENKE